jgi:gamma-glutamyltranspeptidase/glutathione hydrolase
MVKEQYDQYRVHLNGQKQNEISVARGKGAVASVSREASQFAIDVLKDGGNAFDAAFMLAFALALCHPQAGNLGGGGYIIFKEKERARPIVYNYREESPSKVTIEHYLKEDGSTDAARTAFGPSSICIPGTVRAFFLLQKRYGKLKSFDLLMHLAQFALLGPQITAYQAACLNRLKPKLNHSPESRNIFVKSEGEFQTGENLPNPNLGRTFETLAREGEKAFYRGEIAESIEKDLIQNGGFITSRDLAGYAVHEIHPLRTEISGYTVWTVPPEGGGAILIEVLNILNNSTFLAIEPYTPDFYHYLAQACKIAFVDRMGYMGDIDLAKNQIYGNIFKSGPIDERFRLIDKSNDIKTSEYAEKLHGTNFDEFMKPLIGGGQETTHFSVIDSEGNGVSNSYSLNLRYGSKWSITDTGMLMNCSMDGLSYGPGSTNYFGLLGNKANVFGNRKRPASNMAPILVTRGNDLHMLLGSPGGPMIPSTLAMILLSVLHHGINPLDSVGEGRIHHQGWPDLLYRESHNDLLHSLDPLLARGYRIEEKREPIGDVQGIFRIDDEYLAVSDYRREGCAQAL